MYVGGWDLQALREISAHRPVIDAGCGPRLADTHRDQFELLHRGLARPWEECQVLQLRYRWCPSCSVYTVYEIFSDDGARLWTICWECGWLMGVFMRTQVAELANAIHNPERVIYEAPELAQLTRERLVTAGG